MALADNSRPLSWLIRTLLYAEFMLLCKSSQLTDSLTSTDPSKPKDFNQVLYKRFTFLKEDNFEDIIADSGFNGHLVFFGARWCSHSRQFNSTFKQLADVVMRGHLSRTTTLSFS